MYNFRLVALLSLIAVVFALDNGLGWTPQMGWNSWNHYGCGVNEQVIRQTADAFISTGLAAVGYKYVNVDDCWAYSRNSSNVIQADPTTFPSGMAALASYVHSKGLLFGLYSDAGTKTCAGRPGSLGYETTDADTYAIWQVDYLKYDNCNANTSPEVRYPVMRDALNATNRRIFYSMCEWGVDNPATWAPKVGNSWRTTGDISDNWNSMLSNLDSNNQWASYAAPEGWNDPDMLEVGNGGMSTTEYQSHFALWCLVKSPLLIGCDLTDVNAADLAILNNTELIAINQDKLGVQGSKLVSSNSLEVWGGPLTSSRYCVILFNRSGSTASITVNFSVLNTTTTSFQLRDLYAHKDLGSFSKSYTGSNIPSHGVQALLLTPSS